MGDIKYDEDEKISYLSVLAGQKSVFCWRKIENGVPASEPAAEESPAEESPADEATATATRYMCAECGSEILASVYDGTSFDPRVIAVKTTDKYGLPLCWNCYMKRQFGDRTGTGDV